MVAEILGKKRVCVMLRVLALPHQGHCNQKKERASDEDYILSICEVDLGVKSGSVCEVDFGVKMEYYY